MKKYELVADIYVKYAIAENAWNACKSDILVEKSRHPMGHLLLNHGCGFETLRCFQRTLKDHNMKRVERRTIKELLKLAERIDEIINIYNG